MAELAGRGHRVDLLADSVEDAAALPSANVKTCTAYCHRGRVSGWAFRAFIGRSLDERAGAGRVYDAALSFTRLISSPWVLSRLTPQPAPPSVWVPLGRPAAGTLRELAHLLRHPLKPEAIWRRLRLTPHRLTRARLERLAAGELGPGDLAVLFSAGTPASVADINAFTADPDRRLVVLPPVRTHARPSDDASHALREATRAALGIPPERAVVVVSADGASARDLLPLLQAAAALHTRSGDLAPPPPTLVVLSREPGYVHDASRRAGLLAHAAGVRLIPPTRRFDALLAAADLCAILPAGERAAPHAAGSRRAPAHDPARFIADALAAHRPVIAPAEAPGAGLLTPLGRPGEVDSPRSSANPPYGAGSGGGVHGVSGRHGPGLALPENSASAWHRALSALLPVVARRAASDTARAVADVRTLTIPRLVDRLEQVLAQLSARGAGTADGE
jgi:hypothetical protein